MYVPLFVFQKRIRVVKTEVRSRRRRKDKSKDFLFYFMRPAVVQWSAPLPCISQGMGVHFEEHLTGVTATAHKFHLSI